MQVLQTHAAYDLAALPADQKQSICDKQVAFCLSTCNQEVLRNSCDITSMKFECFCKRELPISYHYFPIQSQQCVGENQDCRNDCVSVDPTGVNIDTCVTMCDQYFACGSPNAKEKKNFSISSEEKNVIKNYEIETNNSSDKLNCFRITFARVLVMLVWFTYQLM